MYLLQNDILIQPYTVQKYLRANNISPYSLTYKM